jgi:type III secretion system FlhB-like substrate exporter
VNELGNTPVSALLELAASQLEVAAHTTDTQVHTLANSIAALVSLSVELQASSGAGTVPGSLAHKIVEQAQSAMVAMQFHDQLVQRMAHVRDSLTELNEALSGGSVSEVDWATVLAGIRFRYSMEDERLQFDRIIGSAACDAQHDHTHDSLRGSVELF